MEESHFLHSEKQISRHQNQLKVLKDDTQDAGSEVKKHKLKKMTVGILKGNAGHQVKPRLTFNPYGDHQHNYQKLARLSKGLGLNCSYFDYSKLIEHQNVVLRIDSKSKALKIESQALIDDRIYDNCCSLNPFNRARSHSEDPSGSKHQLHGGYKVNKVSIVVKLETLAGFLVGASSSRFKMFHSLVPETKTDTDQWKFVSLVDIRGATYDFRFTDFRDSRDFIIAISESAQH